MRTPPCPARPPFCPATAVSETEVAERRGQRWTSTTATASRERSSASRRASSRQGARRRRHVRPDRASPRIESRSDRVRNGPRKNRRAGVSILYERVPRPRARPAIPLLQPLQPFNLFNPSTPSTHSTLNSPRSRSAKTVLICRRESARLRARFAPLQTADPLKPGKFTRSKAACRQGACIARPFLRVS